MALRERNCTLDTGRHRSVTRSSLAASAIGGRKVPQLVQQRFHFRLGHATPGLRIPVSVP
jgi:hypothetical protein